jgi:peptidoglycan/xylan/chitin deacetylase (PgdA/CDA1 family)
MLKKYLLMITSITLILCHQFVYADDAFNGDTNTDNITKIINCDENQQGLPGPKQIPPYSWKGSGLITLWFDDGWVTEYTNGLPLMKKYGYEGAVAVAVKLICYPAFMNWDQLRTLQDLGWETTAHTVNHNCDLGYYTTKTTLYELDGSKEMIKSHGLRADHFVMPCGYNDQQIDAMFESAHPPIIETAKKYFESYRTTEYERINAIPVLDPYNLKALQLRNTTSDQEIKTMINKAINEHGWLIIVIHQIDNTNRPFSITPEKFEKVLAMVKASKLPVVLPTQVLAIKKR